MSSFDDKYMIYVIVYRSSVSSSSSMSGRLKREYLGNKYERVFYSFIYSVMHVSLKSKGSYLFLLVEFLQFISLSFNKIVHTDSFSKGFLAFLQFFRQPFYIITKNYKADFWISTSIVLLLVLLCAYIFLTLMLNGAPPDWSIKIFDILYIITIKLFNIPLIYSFFQFMICHKVNDTYYSLVLPDFRTFNGIGILYFFFAVVCSVFLILFTLISSLLWLNNENGCLLSKLHGRFDIIAEVMKLVIITIYQLSSVIDITIVFAVSYVASVILVCSFIWYLPFIRLFTNQLKCITYSVYFWSVNSYMISYYANSKLGTILFLALAIIFILLGMYLPLLRRLWVFNYFKLMTKKNSVTPLSADTNRSSSTEISSSKSISTMSPTVTATERPKTWRNRLYFDIDIGGFMLKNNKDIRSNDFSRRVMDSLRHIKYSVDIVIASAIFFEIADTTPGDQLKKFRIVMDKYGIKLFKKYEKMFVESDLFWSCYLNLSLVTKLDTKRIFSSKNDSISTFDIRFLIYRYIVQEETSGDKKASNYLNYTKSLKNALKWHKEAINLEKAFWEGLSLARELPNNVLLKRTHNLFNKISEADRQAYKTYSKLMKTYSHNSMLLRFYGLYLSHIRGDYFHSEELFNWADDIEQTKECAGNEEEGNELDQMMKRNEEGDGRNSLNEFQPKREFRIKLGTVGEEQLEEKYKSGGVLKKEKSDDCGLDDDLENNDANFGDCDIDEGEYTYQYNNFSSTPIPASNTATNTPVATTNTPAATTNPVQNKWAIQFDATEEEKEGAEMGEGEKATLTEEANKKEEEKKEEENKNDVEEVVKKEEEKKDEVKESDKNDNNNPDEVVKFDETKEEKKDEEKKEEKEDNQPNVNKIIVSPLNTTSVSMSEWLKQIKSNDNSDTTIDLNKSSGNEENKSDKKTDSNHSGSQDSTVAVPPLKFDNLSPNTIEYNESPSITNINNNSKTFTFPNDTKITKSESVHLKPKFAIDLNPVTMIVNSADDERNQQVVVKPKFAIKLDNIDEEDAARKSGKNDPLQNNFNNKNPHKSYLRDSKMSKYSGRSNLKSSRRGGNHTSRKRKMSDVFEEIKAFNTARGNENDDESDNGLGIVALERFSLFFVTFVGAMGIIVPGLIIILLLCVTDAGQTLLNIQAKHLYHMWISSIESRDIVLNSNYITASRLDLLKNDIEMCKKYQTLIMSCKSKSAFRKYSCSQLPSFTTLRTTHVMYLDNSKNYSSSVPIIQGCNEYIYAFQTILAKMKNTYNTPYNNLDYQFITSNSYSVLPDLILPVNKYADTLKDNTQIFTIIILVFIFINVIILVICAYFLRRNIGLAHKEQHLGLDTLKLIPIEECTRITEKFVGLYRNFNVNVNDEDNGKRVVETLQNMDLDDDDDDDDDFYYDIGEEKKSDENNSDSKTHRNSTLKIMNDPKVQKQFKEMEKKSYNCYTRKKYTYLVLIYFFAEFVTVTVALVLLLISIISFKGRINELEILSTTIHDMGNVYYKAGDLILHKYDSVLYPKIKNEMEKGISDMIKNYDCLIYGCDNTGTKGMSQLNDDILNLYFYDYDDNQNTYDSAIMKFERAASLFIAEPKDKLITDNVQYQIMRLIFNNRLMSEKFERAIDYFEDLRNNSFVTSLVLIICVFVLLFIVNILGYKYILTFFSSSFLRDVMLVRFLLANVGLKAQHQVPVMVMYLEKTKWVESRKETTEIEDDAMF